MLLLRDFLVDFPAKGALLLSSAIAPISAVMFSLSIEPEDGTCANDLRDFGLAAGRVMSSREAMSIDGSEADCELRYPNRKAKIGVGSYRDIIYNSDV
jgi:hypothetical protein